MEYDIPARNDSLYFDVIKKVTLLIIRITYEESRVGFGIKLVIGGMVSIISQASNDFEVLKITNGIV